jgi:hypothetical protein
MLRSFLGVVAAVLFAATSLSALAQDGETKEQKYEKKVAESWFKDNGFTDDYEAAKKKSAETGKPIFAYFTRSYAP